MNPTLQRSNEEILPTADVTHLSRLPIRRRRVHSMRDAYARASIVTRSPHRRGRTEAQRELEIEQRVMQAANQLVASSLSSSHSPTEERRFTFRKHKGEDLHVPAQKRIHWEQQSVKLEPSDNNICITRYHMSRLAYCMFFPLEQAKREAAEQNKKDILILDSHATAYVLPYRNSPEDKGEFLHIFNTIDREDNLFIERYNFSEWIANEGIYIFEILKPLTH